MATSSSSSLFLLVLLVSLLQIYLKVDGSGGGGGGMGASGRRELVPAMFVFGDSLIDNGNNNDLPSFAKANYYPYGIDFAGGAATGRFSNGYTIVDEIADLLELPLTPANSEASGEDILHGVNYASAAAGILDITGRNFVGRIPFNQQITNFQTTIARLSANIGLQAARESLSSCLFFVGLGSNDYLNNYLMPNYNTRFLYNANQFAELLVNQYRLQLIRLYNLGARKFIIAGVGTLGCTPSILAQSFQNHCSAEVNSLVHPFNENVREMLDNLNVNLPNAGFIFIDIYHMFIDILNNPKSYGFSVLDSGCCGIGRNSGQISCLPMQTPCPNRKQYVFWDAFHPTAAVNIILARKAFSGSLNEVYPMNIQQLVFASLNRRR